jgi:hypothetical protein
MTPPGAPSGQRIVRELVREMQDRLYPLFYRTLAPGLYHVYLHQEDYREIEGIASLIVLDAQAALSARVTTMNRRARWTALLSDHTAIEPPAGGWEIHINPDANRELARGELGIVSRLSMPAAPQFEGGTPTTRIVRTVVTATSRRSVSTDEAAAPIPPSSGPPVPPQGRHVAATEQPAARLPAPADSPPGFARLAYVDEEGPHVYAMTKEVVSIGRGGREHWVDVQLVTTARVSREHCRIRRDAQGRFFLHDLSTWGTSVDGTRVPPPGADGALPREADERELPPQARIQLADAVVIDFQAPPTT